MMDPIVGWAFVCCCVGWLAYEWVLDRIERGEDDPEIRL